MAFAIEDVTINTIIGAGSAVAGDIRINGVIRVDGDVNGDIETTSNIIIGDKARIRGNIKAASAIVGGIVIGDVTAPKGIHLLSTCAIIGNVTTKSLQIDEDVVLNGHCISLSDEETYEKSLQDFLIERSIKSKAI